MKPSFLQGVLPVVGLIIAVSTCAAQGQAHDDLHGLHIAQLPMRPTPTPFPLDARTGRVQELEFRSPEQMTAADKTLAESAQGEIERRAALQGFRGVGNANSAEEEISRNGGWGYEQAVCPVFPEHLILEYSRINGAGDVTLFSAVVPRAEGHVRVIPVRRRSYSLWTPASSNALTLNDFNHMVKEGETGLSPDWLRLSLCYAALAGGHVRAALVAGKPADESYPLLAPAKLSVSRKGGATVYFADSTPEVKHLQWSLVFAQSGRLMKVRHDGARELVEKPVVGSASEVKGTPTRESAVDLGKTQN